MRADARRNRRRIVEAAVEVIQEVGGQPPLDLIARRAGVGAGTLYRRFPDRDALLRAAALHLLEQAIAAAERADADADTGFDALRQYMHAAFDLGVGALNLLHPLLDDPDWSTQRARIEPLLHRLVERSKEEGAVRSDLDPADIAIPVLRFSRPLAMGITRDKERALARRHLDIYIAGLAATPDLAQ